MISLRHSSRRKVLKVMICMVNSETSSRSWKIWSRTLQRPMNSTRMQNLRNRSSLNRRHFITRTASNCWISKSSFPSAPSSTSKTAAILISEADLSSEAYSAEILMLRHSPLLQRAQPLVCCRTKPCCPNCRKLMSASWTQMLNSALSTKVMSWLAWGEIWLKRNASCATSKTKSVTCSTISILMKLRGKPIAHSRIKFYCLKFQTWSKISSWLTKLPLTHNLLLIALMSNVWSKSLKSWRNAWGISKLMRGITWTA